MDVYGEVFHGVDLVLTSCIQVPQLKWCHCPTTALCAHTHQYTLVPYGYIRCVSELIKTSNSIVVL